MKRRDFVSRVALGAAAACTLGRSSVSAAAGTLNLRFIGMMGFIERRDHSYLVATPGETHHHMAHLPFLMARAGTRVATALDMKPVAGVIPAAFDTELVGTQPSEFVYRSLANTAIEVVSGTSSAVANQATEMAQLQDIAPGKRVRGNIEKWASATVSLRGGRIQNSSAHPDAGKVWSFGSYRQRLTDAVNYCNDPGTGASLRLTSGVDASTVEFGAGETGEMWVISAADFSDRMNNPTKLIHSELIFDYLVDAQPLIAECADATGREVPATALPFGRPTTASRGWMGAEATMPPFTDFCYIMNVLLGTSK